MVKSDGIDPLKHFSYLYLLTSTLKNIEKDRSPERIRPTCGGMKNHAIGLDQTTLSDLHIYH